jgi:hypothetical protein
LTRFCLAGQTLLVEVNAKYPDRPKGVLDGEGIFGDPRHAARESDHNPNDYGVVTAWDIAAAPFVNQLVNLLKESRDKRLKYIIWNHHIWSLARASEGWREYDGEDPHTGHAHISFSASALQYDRTDPWNIYKEVDDEDMTPEQDKRQKHIEDMLEKLTTNRRPDKKDADKTHLSLADLYNQGEEIKNAVS